MTSNALVYLFRERVSMFSFVIAKFKLHYAVWYCCCIFLKIELQDALNVVHLNWLLWIWWVCTHILSSLLLVNFLSHRRWKSKIYIYWILCNWSPWYRLGFITKMQQLNSRETETSISYWFFPILLDSGCIHYFAFLSSPCSGGGDSIIQRLSNLWRPTTQRHELFSQESHWQTGEYSFSIFCSFISTCIKCLLLLNMLCVVLVSGTEPWLI